MNDGQIIAPAQPHRRSTIKGLMPSLPERGKIKIGVKGAIMTTRAGKEFQPPQKLDHFVVTTLDRGGDGNFLRDLEIHSRLGDRPTELPIRLLYDDPTINFPTRYACYVGRSLWCSGDGEVAMRADKGQPRQVECPCPRKEPGYAGNDGCKMNGVLSVLLECGRGIGGVWKFRTTSYNSIVGIMSSLTFIHNVTGGILANIPLRLVVRPKQAAKPDGSPVLIYFVSVEFDGEMSHLQSLAHRIALDRARTHVSIREIEAEARKLLALPPPNAPLAGDDANDIVDEFYPEQAQAALQDERPAAPAVEIEPEPPRAAPAQSYLVIDADGEVHDNMDWRGAAQLISETFSAAARRGKDALKAAGENNAATIDALRAAGHEGVCGELRGEFRALLMPRTNSPTGPTEQLKPGKDASYTGADLLHAGPAPGPAGDAIDDLLGGDARPAANYHVRLPDQPTSDDWRGFPIAIAAMLDAGDPPAEILRDNRTNLEIFAQVDEMTHSRLMRTLDAAGG